MKTTSTAGKKKTRAAVRTPPGKPSALRAPARAEDEFPIDETGETDPDSRGDGDRPVRHDPPPNATAIVVRAAFEAAVTKQTRRRLRHGQALAATVIVPTADWVAPVAAHVRSEYGDRWCVHQRDGTDRKASASTGSVDVARDLSNGGCVMGIAADARMLPAALTAAADIALRIAAPDGAVLRKAIARFARRSPGEIASNAGAGLGLHSIVAAFRPGTGPLAIVRRLEAATGAGRANAARVPALQTAVEYGEARLWGLDLARDIAAYRQGRIAWRDVDRGVCLHSPPGMGKSLFARVVAKGCEVPLVTTSVAEWFAAGPGYLDSVIKEMRSAFARAASLASPVCILFLDEIDALPDRATLSERGRDWWMPVISDALTLLDSAVSERAGIVVIGATNAIGRVDGALLRPGRLERVVEVPRPDSAGAINIVRFHLNGEIADDLTPLGHLLSGATGAEIMLAVRSARRAARNAGRPMTVEDIKEAVMPAEAHPPARLRRMAVHEAAHAVAAMALSAGTVDRVALASSGSSGGRTVVTYPQADLDTRTSIENRVIVGLAARAAERLITGTVSSGAGGALHSDIGQATLLVASIHASFGLGESLAYRGFGEDLLREVALDRPLRELVEGELRRLEARAAEIVAANRDAIEALAFRLAEKRHLGRAEVEEIVRGRLVAPVADGNAREEKDRC